MPKPPTPRAQIKILREELRYWQMIVRMDIKGLERSKEAVKRIAAKMRKLTIDNQKFTKKVK